MTTKAERTKKHIIQTASLIFHKKGYANTSMSDILTATGLTKGGIYGNFKSKEEIAMEAFDYNTNRLFEQAGQLIDSTSLTSIEKLYSVLKLHYKNLQDLKLDGRCPILNTAVETDENNPWLWEKVVRVMEQWQQSLIKIMVEGIAKHEMKDSISPEYYAGLFISLIEGGVLLSRIYRSPSYISNNLQEIKKIIITDLVRS